MRLVKRVDDAGGRREGSYEGGYGTQDAGEGQADGYGWGWCGAGDIESAYGNGDGNVGHRGGAGFALALVLPVTNHSARRTERLFRCAGCVGGYECSIHGVRL